MTNEERLAKVERELAALLAALRGDRATGKARRGTPRSVGVTEGEP